MGVLSALRGGALAWLTLGGSTVAAVPQTSLEREVKAAFLYNFTRFVQWPAGLPRNGEPFRLCAIADGEMTRVIERTVAGESVNGRPLVVTQPQRPEDAHGCQILYVGRSERQRAARLLAAVRNLPVLTVGDASRFMEQGGVIEFVLQEGLVRFDVNMSAVQRSNLKLSSNLLRVARHVEPTR